MMDCAFLLQLFTVHLSLHTHICNADTPACTSNLVYSCPLEQRTYHALALIYVVQSTTWLLQKVCNEVNYPNMEQKSQMHTVSASILELHRRCFIAIPFQQQNLLTNHEKGRQNVG